MKKLGEVLVERGWAGSADIDRALHAQQAAGGRLGTCLLEASIIDETRLLEALSSQLEVPAVDPDRLRTIPEDTFRMVSNRLVRKLRAVPFRQRGDRLEVAMLDPKDLAIQDELAFATGKHIEPFVAPEARIVEALERYYQTDCPGRISRLLDRLNRSRYLWNQEEDDFGSDALFATPPELALPAGEEAAYGSPDGEAAATASATVLDDFSAEAVILEPESTIQLTAEQAFTVLAATSDRETIGETLTDFLLQSCERVALLGATRRAFVPWKAGGQGLQHQRFAEFSLPATQPSLFKALREGVDHHFGPLPPMPSHRRLMACWDGAMPKVCIIVPIAIGERLVAVLYGDRRRDAVVGLDLTTLQRLANVAAAALERCIVLKKQAQPEN